MERTSNFPLLRLPSRNIFNVFLYKGIESAELSTLQPSFYLCIDNYNIYYTQNTLQLVYLFKHSQ